MWHKQIDDLPQINDRPKLSAHFYNALRMYWRYFPYIVIIVDLGHTMILGTTSICDWTGLVTLVVIIRVTLINNEVAQLKF